MQFLGKFLVNSCRTSTLAVSGTIYEGRISLDVLME
jgi:hypothetical protein